MYANIPDDIMDQDGVIYMAFIEKPSWITRGMLALTLGYIEAHLCNYKLYSDCIILDCENYSDLEIAMDGLVEMITHLIESNPQEE